MPGATPVFGLPYPMEGELQEAQNIQNLAIASEAAINANLNPVEVVLTTINGWMPNPAGPVTLTVVGKLVVATGEVFKGGPPSEEIFASIPFAYRPNVERIKVRAIGRSSSTDICSVTAWGDGRMVIENPTGYGTTPGWNFNLTWVRD